MTHQRHSEFVEWAMLRRYRGAIVELIPSTGRHTVPPLRKQVNNILSLTKGCRGVTAKRPGENEWTFVHHLV